MKLAALAMLLLSGCTERNMPHPRLHRVTLGTHYDFDRRELTGADASVQIDLDGRSGD